jgi:hypothetical protein
MGACWSPYTDVYPSTVVEVSKNVKHIVTLDNDYKVVDGSILDGSAKYEIDVNPNGPRREWSLRKNGKWVAVGSDMYTGARLSLGTRRVYRDPSF